MDSTHRGLSEVAVSNFVKTKDKYIYKNKIFFVRTPIHPIFGIFPIFQTEMLFWQ